MQDTVGNTESDELPTHKKLMRWSQEVQWAKHDIAQQNKGPALELQRSGDRITGKGEMRQRLTEDEHVSEVSKEEQFSQAGRWKLPHTEGPEVALQEGRWACLRKLSGDGGRQWVERLEAGGYSPGPCKGGCLARGRSLEQPPLTWPVSSLTK